MNTDQSLQPGTRLSGGGYVLHRVLGQGGFGITYEAFQYGLNRKVAIKEFFVGDFCYREGVTEVATSSASLASFEVQKNKFIKEARMIASLSHPNIVKIIDVFEEHNTAYYVMEFIGTDSLQSYVERTGALVEKQALNLISQIANALDYIHSRKILHLDIKPANIMLAANDKAILIDFGISKHYDEEGVQTTTTLGGLSPGYSPLEQYLKGGMGKFTPATDIYALGATLAFMITGKRPPESQIVNEEGLPPLPDKYSRELRETILSAMRPAKAERLQSASAFVEALKTGRIENDTTAHLRYIIESLEMQGEYKEAYLRCLECINQGKDVEYARAKSNYLIPLMKKKNEDSRNRMYFWAVVATILFFLLPFLIAYFSA